MNYSIQNMTQKNALIIANEWRYSDDYSFYNIDADLEDYEEFIDIKKRGDSYYQVLLDGDLVGFLSYTVNDVIADIGIGLKPELTGQGLGSSYLQACMEFLILKHKDIKEITLSVASFNERAIKLYEKLGFTKTKSFNQPTNGGIYPFISMKKIIK